jgi:MoaA/NifB/PqqE/SkfB family radical SAM enzyme
LSRKLTAREMIAGGNGFVRYLLRGGLFNVNLEVTKRCNARCDFCDYWKTESPAELQDYVPVIKKLAPLSVGITGGEPLMRDDLAEVIASLRRSFSFLTIGLITNGRLLTAERGAELWQAGLDELSVSLDYVDERHDRERGLPGLTQHILSLVPALRAAGVKLCFNVVIKQGNYQELPQIIRRAHAMGVRISLSTYNCWRINNARHMLQPSEHLALRAVIDEVKGLKRVLGNLSTSEYYLERVPRFFAQRAIVGCTAGLNWVQVTPDGMIKRCSDHPVACHFSSWRAGYFAPTECARCWYSCRGAAQEPWTVERFIAEAKEALQADERGERRGDCQTLS